MPTIIREGINRGEVQTIYNQFNTPTPLDPNIVNRKSQTGAVLACIHNQPEVLQVFIDAKADLQLKDCRGRSVVCHAIQNVDKWTGNPGDKWQCMDKLVVQLGRECVLKQAATVNLLKTVEYTLVDSHYDDTRASYLNAMEAATDDGKKVEAILKIASQKAHSEIMCLVKPPRGTEGEESLSESGTQRLR